MADRGVPVDAHRDRILDLVTPLPSVTVPLADAGGLVAATDVPAAIDLPRFDHAAMDGYAVRAADVAAAPAELPVAGVVAAGDARQPTLEPGCAWRIMTGAPVPTGADAVVPFESTDRGTERVRIHHPVPENRHIRRAGEDVRAGTIAVAAGTLLAPRHLALLAGVGVAEVAVHPAPRVAVVATGEELVAPDAVDSADPAGIWAPGRVTDSNTLAVLGAARAAGARAASYGPVPDDPALLLERLCEAAEHADLVVTTGGVSAGDHDVVKAALRDHAGFWFGSVAVKPGRPQGVGVLVASDTRHVPVVCLPGTPVAAHSSFLLFAEPAIRRLAGRPAQPVGRAILDADVVAADRTLILPAAYVAPGRVAQLAGHVGHSQRLLADADVLLVVPPGEGVLPAGDEVVVLPLGSVH